MDADQAAALATGSPTDWRHPGQCSEVSAWAVAPLPLAWRISTSSVPQRVQMVAARAQPGQKATWVMP
jgi:hypothetical protein